MTAEQERKYHAAIQIILNFRGHLSQNAYVYLVDNGDIWLRFTKQPEVQVDGYRLSLLLSITA